MSSAYALRRHLNRKVPCVPAPRDDDSIGTQSNRNTTDNITHAIVPYEQSREISRLEEENEIETCGVCGTDLSRLSKQQKKNHKYRCGKRIARDRDASSVIDDGSSVDCTVSHASHTAFVQRIAHLTRQNQSLHHQVESLRDRVEQQDLLYSSLRKDLDTWKIYQTRLHKQHYHILETMDSTSRQPHNINQHTTNIQASIIPQSASMTNTSSHFTLPFYDPRSDSQPQGAHNASVHVNMNLGNIGQSAVLTNARHDIANIEDKDNITNYDDDSETCTSLTLEPMYAVNVVYQNNPMFDRQTIQSIEASHMDYKPTGYDMISHMTHAITQDGSSTRAKKAITGGPNEFCYIPSENRRYPIYVREAIPFMKEGKIVQNPMSTLLVNHMWTLVEESNMKDIQHVLMVMMYIAYINERRYRNIRRRIDGKFDVLENFQLVPCDTDFIFYSIYENVIAGMLRYFDTVSDVCMTSYRKNVLTNIQQLHNDSSKKDEVYVLFKKEIIHLYYELPEFCRDYETIDWEDFTD